MESGAAGPFSANADGTSTRVSCTCKLRATGFPYATMAKQATKKAEENMTGRHRESEVTEGCRLGRERHHGEVAL